MTKQQVAEIITLLQSEYPQSFSRMDARQMQAKIRLWADEFKEDNADAVYAAVRAIIGTEAREFAPNIGQIKNRMYELSRADDLDEGQAWAMVAKACQNGIYGFKAEFDRLPPVVQAAVGSPEQIKAWAILGEDEFQTVAGSHFRRAFRISKQWAKEREMLPGNVQALISDLAERVALERKADGT